MLPLMVGALALQAGGLGYSIFSGRKKSGPSFDIDRELSNLSSLIATQRAAGKSAIEADYTENRSQIANSLAARGTYRSPVAEASFNRVRQARTLALTQLEGQLAGMEAGTRTGLMRALMGERREADALGGQRRAALAGQIGSIGSTLMMSALTRPGTPGVNTAGAAATPSIAGTPQGNYIMPNPSYAYNPSYGSNAFHFPTR